jgi:MYXO-CTERM domain-containing protein
VSPAASPVAGQNDLQLYVNTSTGDVSLMNTAATTTAFTAYNIDVLNNATNVLLVGNPADHTKGSGPTGVAPRTKAPPYTGELLLSETATTGTSSANYNSSAAAYGNNPVTWKTVQDGFNGNQSAFGLAESFTATTVSDEITIPVNGSIDLGDIFNTLGSQSDLQFTWSPETSSGGNSLQTPYSGTIDYVGGAPTPEPGMLGMLGLGGIAMMRRRRKTAGNGTSQA